MTTGVTNLPVVHPYGLLDEVIGELVVDHTSVLNILVAEE